MLVAYSVALDLIRALRPVVAELASTAAMPPIRWSAPRAASCTTSPREIMDRQEAARDLQLAALSVVAHGKGNVDIAVKIAVALGKAVDALPGTDQWLYLSLIDNALSKAAKEELQMMPEVPKYFSETLRRSLDTYVTEGRAEGVAEGEVKALLKILAQRGLALSDDQQRRIRECTDIATLDGWLDRALRVASVDELLK